MSNIETESIMEQALGLARGSYQRNLIRGFETWSGSSLRGRAAEYAGRYSTSRSNLLDRIEGAGLGAVFRGRRARAVLLLGAAADYARQADREARRIHRECNSASSAMYAAERQLSSAQEALEVAKEDVVELTDEGVVIPDLRLLKDEVWEAAVALRTAEGLLKEAKAAETAAWQAAWNAIEEAEEMEP
jgi:hypothetical protein